MHNIPGTQHKSKNHTKRVPSTCVHTWAHTNVYMFLCSTRHFGTYVSDLWSSDSCPWLWPSECPRPPFTNWGSRSSVAQSTRSGILCACVWGCKRECMRVHNHFKRMCRETKCEAARVVCVGVRARCRAALIGAFLTVLPSLRALSLKRNAPSSSRLCYFLIQNMKWGSNKLVNIIFLYICTLIILYVDYWNSVYIIFVWFVIFLRFGRMKPIHWS